MAKVSKTCETCGIYYCVPKYRESKSRFCSMSCRSSWIASQYLNKGEKPWASANLDGHRHKSSSRFVNGNEPWNKGVKGIHLSPETEFKKGRDSEKYMPLLSVTVRDCKGVNRRFIKISEPNVWEPYARYVWRNEKGDIPDDWVVHHKDRDTMNDEICNLQAMSREDHMEEHRSEFMNQSPVPKQETLF